MADIFFGITDTGKVRGNNEDAFIAEQVFNNKFIIACAIDGVGGYAGGEIAAEIARESILDKLSTPSGDIIAAMKAAFLVANDKIIERKLQSEELGKMACVLTLAVVDNENNQFYYAHIGDTRLYLWRDGSLVKVTKDHSFVGFLEDSGRLDEKAAMSHLKRNEINKALGFGKEINHQDDYIETGVSPFLPGDVILLCSDGLTDMVPKEQITSVLGTQLSLPEKANVLVEKANTNGGKDNITVVLVANNTESSFRGTPAANKAEASRTPASDLKPREVRSPAASNQQPVNESHANSHSTAPSAKTGSSATVILALLCIIFLVSTLFFFWKSSEKATEISPVPVTISDNRNADEIKLQDAINSVSGNILVLTDSAFQQPITLTDTLTIGQDSLYILAKGNITIKADTAFGGPAIKLFDESKFVLLEGLTFEDFDVAIASPNNALALKNVQFVNCKHAVQSFFTTKAQQKVNGRLSTNLLSLDDTLIIP